MTLTLPFPPGEKGAVFASLPDGTSHPSTIHYRPFDTWSSSAEWSYDLPSSEVVTALCAGGPPTDEDAPSTERDKTGSVVVATDRGYLRFLTGSGVQRYVWTLGEEVVCMVGGHSEVFVVHREGGTSLDGSSSFVLRRALPR